MDEPATAWASEMTAILIGSAANAKVGTRAARQALAMLVNRRGSWGRMVSPCMGPQAAAGTTWIRDPVCTHTPAAPAADNYQSTGRWSADKYATSSAAPARALDLRPQ